MTPYERSEKIFLDIKNKLTRLGSHELDFIDFSCVFACDLAYDWHTWHILRDAESPKSLVV